MPRRIRLLPYNPHSQSVRALARATGVLRVRTGGRFRPRRDDVVINWGARDVPHLSYYSTLGVRLLNDPRLSINARDKRRTLELLRTNAVPTVEFTVDIVEAQRWLDAGEVVIQRNTATGQGGAGIVVLDPTLTVNVRATGHGVLWTKYFKRKQEFRIHVWGPDVLDIQLKKRRAGVEADPRIRSYDNGWVFCRQGVASPQCVTEAAVAAVRALALDFGAVDIGYNRRYDRAAVFEVNTAPGIEGTTVERYATKIQELQRAA